MYVTVSDVNDTPPEFSQSRYSAVVPENSPEGTLVVQVMASDPDLGESGEVTFQFPEGSSVALNRLYAIDEETGAITTKAKLTGKGRRAPYVLTVRAFDKGIPQLFSDTEVYVTVGDVSSNDGVPRFVKPEVNEVAYVPEVCICSTHLQYAFAVCICKSFSCSTFILDYFIISELKSWYKSVPSRCHRPR